MWKRERPAPVDLENVLTESPALPPPAVRPVAPRPAPLVEVPAERSFAGRGSTLGATLRFKGDLVADEDLVIQGQVEGSILHSRSLTIGAQGRVRGDIRARRIIVEGSVDGNLYALESVSLRPGATVHGDLFAAGVAIDDGARLDRPHRHGQRAHRPDGQRSRAGLTRSRRPGAVGPGRGHIADGFLRTDRASSASSTARRPPPPA